MSKMSDRRNSAKLGGIKRRAIQTSHSKTRAYAEALQEKFYHREQLYKMAADSALNQTPRRASMDRLHQLVRERPKKFDSGIDFRSKAREAKRSDFQSRFARVDVQEVKVQTILHKQLPYPKFQKEIKDHDFRGALTKEELARRGKRDFTMDVVHPDITNLKHYALQNETLDPVRRKWTRPDPDKAIMRKRNPDLKPYKTALVTPDNQELRKRGLNLTHTHHRTKYSPPTEPRFRAEPEPNRVSPGVRFDWSSGKPLGMMHSPVVADNQRKKCEALELRHTHHREQYVESSEPDFRKPFPPKLNQDIFSPPPPPPSSFTREHRLSYNSKINHYPGRPATAAAALRPDRRSRPGSFPLPRYVTPRPRSRRGSGFSPAQPSPRRPPRTPTLPSSSYKFRSPPQSPAAGTRPLGFWPLGSPASTVRSGRASPASRPMTVASFSRQGSTRSPMPARPNTALSPELAGTQRLLPRYMSTLGGSPASPVSRNTSPASPARSPRTPSRAPSPFKLKRQFSLDSIPDSRPGTSFAAVPMPTSPLSRPMTTASKKRFFMKSNVREDSAAALRNSLRQRKLRVDTGVDIARSQAPALSPTRKSWTLTFKSVSMSKLAADKSVELSASDRIFLK